MTPHAEHAQIQRSEQVHGLITGLAVKAKLDKNGTDSLRTALDTAWKSLTADAKKAGKIPVASINLPLHVNSEKGKVDLLTSWGIIPAGSTFESVVAEMQKSVRQIPNFEQALAEIFKQETPLVQAFVDSSGTHAILTWALDKDVRLLLADGNFHLAVNPEVFRNAETKAQAEKPDTAKEAAKVRRMGVKEFFVKLLGLDRLRIFIKSLTHKRQPPQTLSPQPAA